MPAVVTSRRLLRPALGALTAVLIWPVAATAAPQPFGHECTAQHGVRFCPTRDLDDRVATFDGVPLDVDVTLPPEGDGPWPTIVMLHGWGGDKTDFEAEAPDGRPNAERSRVYHYNNVFYARRGYAVVNHTARGFGRSCGDEQSRTPDCADGWIRLADQRYEVRDAQHLLGLLVDQGVARPDALGATGISYGGGQTMELALLRDRIRLPDGSFARWTSPKGTPLALSAAWPRWLWSDLVYSLLPNGRYLEGTTPPPAYSFQPIGVPIQTYITGLLALGASEGYYAPPGAAPDADLPGWYARVTAGDPYGPATRSIAEEIAAHHQAYGLQGATPPPLLLQSGWTDDLFPIHESLRIYALVRERHPDVPVSLQFGDLGHARAQNKTNADRFFNDQGAAFLDRWVRRDAGAAAPAADAVTAFTQTCPEKAPAGGPFTAPSWDALHPGVVRFSSPPPQTVTFEGGDTETGTKLDPIANPSACTQVTDIDRSGTATYRLPEASGWTLMGRPRVRARIETTGANGQLDSRLWDVAPDGSRVLVTRGAYRLLDEQAGEIVFELWGNGYRFDEGHIAELQLLGRDAPYLRPSNGAFTVEVRDLRLELPVAEGADGAQVASATGRRSRPRLRVRVTPRRDTRGPRRFTTTGRLVRPAGVSREQACHGAVSVQVKAGRRTLSTRRAKVQRSCRFRSRVTFTLPSRFGGRERLQFRVRFHGNRTLARAHSRAVFVRVRR